LGRRYFKPKPKNNRPFYFVNQNIRANSVRLIDADGTQVGVRPLGEALALARTRGLDLVAVAAQANPPVCKVLDFSKFRYEQAKKAREARKKQRAGLLKEVRFRPNIGKADLQVKLKHIREFLGEHDKVRVTVIFRGRENQFKERGRMMLDTLTEGLKDMAAREGTISNAGNRMMMTLVPK